MQQTVSGAFGRSKEAIGYPSPSFVSAELGITPGHPLHETLRSHMYNSPTERFLFWGAKLALKAILKTGDSVAIWTDEYRQRLESSGLPQLQQFGDLSFITGKRKREEIPRLFSLARERGVSEMIVVDDDPANLQAISDYSRQQNLPVRLVLIQKKRGQRQTEDAEDYVVVDTIRKAKHAVRRTEARKKGDTLWVFDFNRTVLNTEAYEQSVIQGARRIVKQGERRRAFF